MGSWTGGEATKNTWNRQVRKDSADSDKIVIPSEAEEKEAEKRQVYTAAGPTRDLLNRMDKLFGKTNEEEQTPTGASPLKLVKQSVGTPDQIPEEFRAIAERDGIVVDDSMIKKKDGLWYNLPEDPKEYIRNYLLG